MEVNIYIELSTVAPRALHASGMYLLDARENGEQLIMAGEPWIKYEIRHFEHINSNVIALSLLKEALSRLQKVDKLQVFTSNETIYWTLANNWIREWRQNGWKTARGLEVKHANEWREIAYLLDKYRWTVSRDHHEWEVWMRNMLNSNGGNKNVG